MGAPGHGLPGGAERKTLDEVSPVTREHELGEAGGKRMKKTSLKELRSFSKAELIRYVQYVEGEPLRRITPLRAHISTSCVWRGSTNGTMQQ